MVLIEERLIHSKASVAFVYHVYLFIFILLFLNPTVYFIYYIRHESEKQTLTKSVSIQNEIHDFA